MSFIPSNFHLIQVIYTVFCCAIANINQKQSGVSIQSEQIDKETIRALRPHIYVVRAWNNVSSSGEMVVMGLVK